MENLYRQAPNGPTLCGEARLFRMLMTCFKQTFNDLRVDCMDSLPGLAGGGGHRYARHEKRQPGKLFSFFIYTVEAAHCFCEGTYGSFNGRRCTATKAHEMTPTSRRGGAGVWSARPSGGTRGEGNILVAVGRKV